MAELLAKRLLERQREEVTGSKIYANLARVVPEPKNKEVLKKIAAVERSHYDFWKRLTNKDVAPSRLKVFFLTWIARIFGLSFGIKLIERVEESNMRALIELKAGIPEIERMIQEEEEFEHALLGLIEEDRLKYTSDIILGLSDALIELTGVLAGLTLALGNPKTIALVALITGLAASMSMTASQYLSAREEEGKNAVKSGLLTGFAYVLTVTMLIFPFFVLTNPFVSLGLSFALVVLIVAAFAFYTSLAQDLPFKRRFLEMCTVCLSVAVLNFGIGKAVNHYIGVEI
jgi:VIT1/CCC1 family predicted Fe2+/Mn2+ transporter